MFFTASKLFWFVAAPTNALVLLALLGSLILFSRFQRSGRWLVLLAATGLIVGGFSPLPRWLLRPLEDRFPAVAMAGPIDGIIVLGGAIGTVRGRTSLNESGARMSDSAALALAFPSARLVFSGGDGTLLPDTSEGEAVTEAESARRFYVSLGIEPGRIVIEDQSRNTLENALFTRRLIQQKPGERWLLITSAWHMPRAVGLFRKAGIDIVPYPVDFTTRGVPHDYRQLSRGFSYGLRLTDLAVKEWIGLAVHRLAGHTDTLLPAP